MDQRLSARIVPCARRRFAVRNGEAGIDSAYAKPFCEPLDVGCPEEEASASFPISIREPKAANGSARLAVSGADHSNCDCRKAEGKKTKMTARSQGRNANPQNTTLAKRANVLFRQRSFQWRIMRNATGRSKTWLKGGMTVGTIKTVRVRANPKAMAKAEELAGCRRARQQNAEAVKDAPIINGQGTVNGISRPSQDPAPGK